MKRFIFKSKRRMGEAAAASAAEKIKQAIENKDQANIILATGTSQFETLRSLVSCEGIAWSKVTVFNLDEYIGIEQSHPASFRRYLNEKFVQKVGNLAAVHFVNGDAQYPNEECKRLAEIISARPIDVALVGIGENGHLAFNDPPADFETQEPFIIVVLDEKCRQQQVSEGWFKSIEDVPRRAISMSIRQIIKSACIIASVPDERKADAVKDALEGQVSNMCPASILQEHPDCEIYLDQAAAAKFADYKE